MEVKTFDISQLKEAKAALKEAFLREELTEEHAALSIIWPCERQ